MNTSTNTNSVKPTCRECGTSSDARLKHFLYSQETGGAFRCATGASPGITTSLATVIEGTTGDCVRLRIVKGHAIKVALVQKDGWIQQLGSLPVSDLSRGLQSRPSRGASKITLFVVNSKGN